MMGNKGQLSAAEWDAFSRRSRPMLNWKPGELKKLKRAFAKRTRQHAKRDARTDANA